MTQQQGGAQGSSATASNTTPVLIYVPGLGRSSDNAADSIAEVIAAALDHDDPGRAFLGEDKP